MATSLEQQGRLPIGSSANASLDELRAPREKSGPFSGGGIHIAFINPFIKLCQQRRILLPWEVSQGQFPFYSITHLDQRRI